MEPSVLLCSDRQSFEEMWRARCAASSFGVRRVSPDQLGENLDAAAAVVIDGAASDVDEDELLAAVGLSRALGRLTAVQVSEARSTGAKAGGGSDDLLVELCQGLVARGETDVPRVARGLLRRLDAERARRFEFVTVSPRDNEILVILGDGAPRVLRRPIDQDDLGEEIVSITMADDASAAELQQSGGGRFRLKAAQVASATRGNGRAATNEGEVDTKPLNGARLGARLRALRLEAGLTQAELARRTGIHRPNIARVEAGRHTPSLETLGRLAGAIGVPATRVLSED